MQKSIYRVRTRNHISQRIAVDMQRDVYNVGLKKTISMLHWSRNGEKRKALNVRCDFDKIINIERTEECFVIV